MAKLTDKQQVFVDEYLIDFNATQAAIRAGYSAKTAEVIGHENLRKPQILVELQKRQRARSECLSLSVDRFEQKLADIAFSEALEPPKTSDQLRALELLGRRHGWLADKTEQSVGISDEEREAVIEAIKRGPAG